MFSTAQTVLCWVHFVRQPTRDARSGSERDGGSPKKALVLNLSNLQSLGKSGVPFLNLMHSYSDRIIYSRKYQIT